MTRTIPPKLIIQFGGWILMRIPTDPDPTDEPRGVSGYTFAFGNEPDLNREIFFQETGTIKARSHTYTIGVHVTSAERIVDGNPGPIPLPDLVGAPIQLLNGPKLENRNWTLTPAGFEPIVPFDFLIQGNNFSIFRSAPLLPDEPNKPVWQIDETTLQAFGAVGVLYEPATIGNATGIWDSMQVIVDRKKALEADRAELQKKKRLAPEEQVEQVILEARIAQLDYAIERPRDRRVMARYYVERFNFPMLGKAVVKGNQQKILQGTISTDAKTPWSIGFWIGAWDPDALAAYVLGALEIPYESTPNTRRR